MGMIRTACYGAGATAVVGRAIHRSVVHRGSEGRASLRLSMNIAGDLAAFSTDYIGEKTPRRPSAVRSGRRSVSSRLASSRLATPRLASPRYSRHVDTTGYEGVKAASQRMLDSRRPVFSIGCRNQPSRAIATIQDRPDVGLLPAKRHCHSSKLSRLTGHAGPYTWLTTSLCTTTRTTLSMTNLAGVTRHKSAGPRVRRSSRTGPRVLGCSACYARGAAELPLA